MNLVGQTDLLSEQLPVHARHTFTLDAARNNHNRTGRVYVRL